MLTQMDNYENALNGVYFALSDPTRRAIIERLVDGPASVTELAAPFTLALPSLMKHLQVLERCELVASRKAGRVRHCTLRPEALRQASAWLHGCLNGSRKAAPQ
jgi:DNA-binding transcriptional ArsR family regulator